MLDLIPFNHFAFDLKTRSTVDKAAKSLHVVTRLTARELLIPKAIPLRSTTLVVDESANWLSHRNDFKALKFVPAWRRRAVFCDDQGS